MRPSIRTETTLVILMLIGFVALAYGFSSGPVFEGPDEIEHYRYVRTLRDTHALPDPAGQPEGQYHQAPLYYLLLLPVAEVMPDGDFAHYGTMINPFYGRQIDLPGNDNTNLYLHSRDESASETARAVHVMRLISVSLGALTVLIASRIFALLWPQHRTRRLAATALVAFWPQFLYMASVVNNDILLILLSTLTLYLLLRQIRQGATWRGSCALGLTLGALVLTKASGLPLAILVGVFWLVQPRLWRYGLLVAALTLALGGWWYGRNLLLYGDPSGIQAMFIAWPTERIGAGIDLPVGLGRLGWTYQTLWARFGEGAVNVGAWLLDGFDLIVVLSLAGWIARIVKVVRGARAVEWHVVLVVGGFASVWVANVVYSASIAWSGNQGRYLLPGIAAWALIVMLGLEALPLRAAVQGAVAALWAGAAVACLTLYFLPAYQALPPPSAIDHPLDLRFGDTAVLIGISPALLSAQPGGQATVELYWQAISPSRTPLYSYLHTDDGTLVRIDSVPGNGHLLATEFEPGQRWTERYLVTIPADAEPQQIHPLLAGLFDPASGQVIAPAAADGAEVLPQVGVLAVSGAAQPLDPAYRLGTGIGLETPQINQAANGLNVCLTWDALQSVGADEQVFVHLLNADQQLVEQIDQPPHAGRYPTSDWSPGERIADCYPLDAPSTPGWTIQIGMYDAQTQDRLPVQDGSGAPLRDNLIVVPIPVQGS